MADGKLSKSDAAKAVEAIDKFDSVIGVLPKTEDALDTDIQQLIDDRLAARKNKDFATADSIRRGAMEISQSSDDLSNRTENQAATLEQTAAARDELEIARLDVDPGDVAQHVALGCRAEASAN